MRLRALKLCAFLGIMPTLALPVAQPTDAVPGLRESLTLAAGGVAQPNFVVIVSDDQRWDSVGRCLPVLDPFDFDAGADACMPNLQDHLMDAGTTFLKGEVTQSLCCPSRASILTGQYSTTTGVTTLDGATFNDSSTVATWLEAAGYRTGLFGKYLNGYGEGTLANYIPPGWDAFESFHGFRLGNGDNPYTNYPWISWEEGDVAPVLTRYKNPDSTSSAACADGNLYSTDFICRLTLDFLAANQTQPFFLYVAPVSPHSPYTIAGRHRGTFASAEIPQYPDMNVLPAPNPPTYLPAAPLSDTTLDHLEANRRKMLELNLPVDDMIGALHDQLTADGRIEETVWVFISDNGIASGEHRWTDKRCEYYVCHRVPFVVVCPPGICTGAQVGVSDPTNYALNIDIAPTLADLAGVTPTLTVDGRSLAPILNNPAAPWRAEWFIHGDVPGYDGIVGVALDGHTYKYVQLTARSQTELYDLDDDPWELVNLAGDAAHASLQSDLAARLAAHLTGPQANLPPSAAFTQSCLDLACDFGDVSTDVDGSIVSWAWSFGDGGTSVLQNPTHSYSAAGTYTVALTATDDDGGAATASDSVTVADSGGPPIAAFVVTCTGLTCGFSDSSVGSVVSWDWNFGDGGTSTEQNPSHAFAAAGTYTVTFVVTDEFGATSTTSSEVIVSEPATTMHIVDLDGSMVRQAGGSWLGIVDVYVAGDTGLAVAGAEVTGSRRSGSVSSCTTDTAGHCQVQFSAQTSRDTFTITDVTHPTLAYQAGDNSDPDGDSNGTSITIEPAIVAGLAAY